ncbi:MAG: TlpA family protein disulfide reductase [Bacteroidetes bacterium]|nr:TlpA family protein disulfide reductase [Bacteroidota bacterium]
MKTINLKIIVKVFATGIIFLLFFTQCKRSFEVELLNKTGTISGRIENYNNECKNGTLLYFDAISRLEQPIVFEINSSGNFSVSFNLPHSTYSTVYLKLCDHVFSLFLEPRTDLQIIMQGDSIQFLGESGISNSQIVMFEAIISKKFRDEIEFLTTLKIDELDFENYISEQTKLAKKKMDFLHAYDKQHILNPSVLNLLKNDIEYSVAHKWLHYRTKYSPNKSVTTDKLPENFYEDLFNTYDINNKNAIVSTNFNNYIADIQMLFSTTQDFEVKSDFIKRAYPFSNDELKMIDGFFDKDTSITFSNEYRFFYNNGFEEILSEYSRRYFVNNILRKSERLPAGIGRDLIISQGLGFYYFNPYHIEPTEKEWLKVDELIESDFILDYLHQLNDSLLVVTSEYSSLSVLPEDVKISSDILNEELLVNYKGNVVYLDFYSTWCIPCRNEIPFAKKLANHFENKEVVFIYICCLSERKNWEKMVARYKLKGDHYYLNEKEYNNLSALFGVKGFPTYILIDKKGRVVNNNAPPPHVGANIYNEIQKLLEEKF